METDKAVNIGRTSLGFGLLLFLAGILASFTPPVSQSNEMDAKAEELINEFMGALMISDFDQSASAIFPFVHKSNFNANKNGISMDLLNFSFKKAHNSASLYEVPVNITRVQELKTTAIGHPSDDSYEEGSEKKYWVAKKNGVNGLPAPLVVFFPADGGAPSIAYMGSL